MVGVASFPGLDPHKKWSLGLGLLYKLSDPSCCYNKLGFPVFGEGEASLLLMPSSLSMSMNVFEN